MLTRPGILPPTKTVSSVHEFLQDFTSISHLQDIYFLWRPFLSDPDDDLILELAFAANASYIVTHNLNDFRGCEALSVIPISPKDFLNVLRSLS